MADIELHKTRSTAYFIPLSTKGSEWIKNNTVDVPYTCQIEFKDEILELMKSDGLEVKQ